MKRRSVMASKKRQQKSERLKQIVIFAILAGLMIISVFSVMLYNDDASGANTIEDSGMLFQQRADGQIVIWETEMAGQDVAFFYLPSQLADISADYNTAALVSPAIFVAFDPAQEDLEFIDFARFHISEDLQLNGQQAIAAITSNSSAYPALPVIDCQTEPVILFRYGNTTSISEQGSCVVVQGVSPQEIIRAGERLRYGYYEAITS